VGGTAQTGNVAGRKSEKTEPSTAEKQHQLVLIRVSEGYSGRILNRHGPARRSGGDGVGAYAWGKIKRELRG